MTLRELLKNRTLPVTVSSYGDVYTVEYVSSFKAMARYLNIKSHQERLLELDGHSDWSLALAPEPKILLWTKMATGELRVDCGGIPLSRLEGWVCLGEIVIKPLEGK